MTGAPTGFSIAAVFRNFGVRARILFCAAVPMIVIAIVAVLGLAGLSEVFHGNEFLQQCHGVIEKAMTVEVLGLEMESGFRGYLLTDQAGRMKRYTDAATRVEQTLKELQDVEKDPARSAILKKAQQSLAAWRKEYAEPIVEQRRQSKSREEVASLPGREAAVEGERHLAEFRTSMAVYSKQYKSYMAKLSEDVKKWNNSTRLMVSAAVPAVIILTMGIFLLFSGTIRRPLIEAGQLVDAVIRGDLSRRIDLKGGVEVRRLGDALTKMVRTIQAQADQILEGLKILSESTSQIAATGAQLSASTSKASAAVSETTSTVEEVKQAAKLAGEKAKHVSRSSQATVKIAESGTQSTEETVQRMSLIRDQMLRRSENCPTSSLRFLTHPKTCSVFCPTDNSSRDSSHFD